MSQRWRGVRDGTPLHGKSLCDSCIFARTIRGEATSEQHVTCDAVSYKPIIVPFRTVVECSSYTLRNTLSLYQMQKMAYVIETDPKGKPIGFKSNQAFRQSSGLDRDDELVHEPWRK
jgi:hypothetical protein